MNRSEQIEALATALAIAQGEMSKAKKDSTNPHFKSRYADLASVSDACLPALNKHGIAVAQFPRLTSVGDEAWVVDVETMLLHESGQFLSDAVSVPVTKVDAQGVGSAITYARRYSLGAMCGVAPEDDDANAAVGPRDGASYTKTDEIVSEGARTDAPDDGQLYVVQMNSKTKAGKTTYSLHFSDGKSFITKSDWLASLAEKFRVDGIPCQRDTNRTYINGLTDAAPKRPLPDPTGGASDNMAEPLDGDDIAF